MLLVFGLGNPGKDYECTYHNAGFLAWSYLRKELAEEEPGVFKTRRTFGYWKHKSIILAAANPEAEIYMNESGAAVQAALSFFKLPTDRLVVFHDDSDLCLGEFKLEFGRGAAGHRGVESVIATLGTPDFWRVRIGIRPKEEKGGRRKAGDFVLKKIKPADLEVLKSVFQEAAKKVMEKS